MKKTSVTVILFLSVISYTASRVMAEDIRDVKSPVDFPSSFILFLFLFILLLGVLAAVLLFRWIQKRKQKEAEVPAPPRPPWDIAHENLDILHAEDLPIKGKIKEYYIRLSDIVRRYIEDRFCIKAPEMTTEEFFFSLKGTNVLAMVQKEALKGFLNNCDMVKFAKYGSSLEEMEQGFSLARRLVDETKERESEYP